MKTLLKTSLAVAAAAASLSVSHGAVLSWGTFSGADPSSPDFITSPANSTVFSQTGGAVAIGFQSTGSDPLSSVTFDLSRNNAVQALTARLRIFSTSTTTDHPSVGNLLYTGTVAVTSTSAGGALSTFSGINLNLPASGSGAYWLVLDAEGGSGSLRVHSQSGSQTPTGDAPFSAVATRVYNETLDSTFSTSTTDYPTFSVTVPEPHEYAMVAGLGLCAFAAYRRRAARLTA